MSVILIDPKLHHSRVCEISSEEKFAPAGQKRHTENNITRGDETLSTLKTSRIFICLVPVPVLDGDSGFPIFHTPAMTPK